MGVRATDRRVRRTRQLLREALVSLILEKGYDRVTVQDILERADVGRSTFYAHYRDKEDLLRSGFADLRHELAGSAVPASPSDRASRPLDPLRGVLDHVLEHRHLYGALSRKGGLELVFRFLREVATDVVRERLRAATGDRWADDARHEAAVQFTARAFIGTVTWWLEDDVPFSPDELFDVFVRLATDGTKRFLAA
jgi:AcrR family transcriptional regulator